MVSTVNVFCPLTQFNKTAMRDEKQNDGLKPFHTENTLMNISYKCNDI